MGDTCAQPPNGGHRLATWIAVLAIVRAMFLSPWARVAVHGTDDIAAALLEPAAEAEAEPAPRPEANPEMRKIDDAVTASRFATGLSP